MLEAKKRVLDVEHPETLASIDNLAFTWKEQGRDTEALKLIEECVQLRIRVLVFSILTPSHIGDVEQMISKVIEALISHVSRVKV